MTAVAPGERWEIEFFSDGTVEVERFFSDRHISGEEALSELLARYSEEEAISLQPPQDAELVTAGSE